MVDSCQEEIALLILDGLEPLQYAPTSPTPGELKDQGLAVLLKGLSATNNGLCVVTTRYAIPDLRTFIGKTVQEVKLTSLSTEAGVVLLQSFGVKGSLRKSIPSADGRDLLNEFEKLVEDVKGHALTLNLLGTYLHDAHAGDIRKRDRFKLEEADTEEQGGHAFRVMDEYVKWFENEGEKGKRAVAILRLLGLFDRPLTADCLTALLEAPAITGLTEAFVGMSEAQRNIAFTRLEAARLLTVSRDASATLLSLDSHPLLREYFAWELRTKQPEAWREGHRRLYEHLCATTKEGDQPTLEDLQPLYQAVAHGCQAGLQQEVNDEVYWRRIERSYKEAYGTQWLGAFASDLGALACFFEKPWLTPSTNLRELSQVVLLGNTAFALRALGRLAESLVPIREAAIRMAKLQEWEQAAIAATNLSELELTLGDVAGAVGDAEQSVTYADRSGDAFQRMSTRTTHADALHQAGRRAEAETRFREAEQMQAERQPDHPLLYSQPGFQYCDLLLAVPERAAWQRTLEYGDLSPLSACDLSPSKSQARRPVDAPLERGSALSTSRQSTQSGDMSPHSKACRAVSERAAQTLKWVTEGKLGLLTIALDHLALGRAALYAAVISSDSPTSVVVARDDEVHSSEAVSLRSALTFRLESAVSGLRSAASQDHIPRGLLTRAWVRSLTGVHTGPESAQTDLDEAWEIAERGPMRLFIADIHLYRARLFHDMKPYPWTSSQEDLAAARKLIEQCGYWRRKEELEDAEAAAENW